MAKKDLIILALGFLFLLPKHSFASYTYYRSITVTSTTSIASGTNSNFPMLVSSTLGTFASVGWGGHVQNLTTAPSGGQEPADLVFATSSANCGTANLNFETESYTSSTGALVDWVNVPSESAGSVIYACYGNSAVTADQSHPSSTWNSNYVNVTHFPNGTSLSLNDSTSNGDNWVNYNANSIPTAVTGQVDGGAGFPFVSGSGNPQLNDANNYGYNVIGIEIWVKILSSGSTDTTIITDPGPYYALRINSSNQVYGIFYSGGTQTTGNTSALSAGWHQIVYTIDGSNGKIYVDGSFATSAAGGTIGPPNSQNQINQYGFAGYAVLNLDEVRISKSPAMLSANWILTEYNNQNSPSTFYSMGSEQGGGGGGIVKRLLDMLFFSSD
jgi:hypothetical protein